MFEPYPGEHCQKDAALRIHGGTDSNTVPAAAGLVETLGIMGKRKYRSVCKILNEDKQKKKGGSLRGRDLNPRPSVI